jgi:hypothetical protein
VAQGKEQGVVQVKLLLRIKPFWQARHPTEEQLIQLEVQKEQPAVEFT